MPVRRKLSRHDTPCDWQDYAMRVLLGYYDPTSTLYRASARQQERDFAAVEHEFPSAWHRKYSAPAGDAREHRKSQGNPATADRKERQ